MGVPRDPRHACRAAGVGSAPARRRKRGSEAGFTLVEIIVTLGLLLPAIVVVVSAFDRSFGLSKVADRKEAASHVAEKEMERLLALPYSRLALTAQPSPSGTAPNPLSYVVTAGSGTCSGSTNCFKWNQRPTLSTASEPLVVDATGGQAGTAGPTAWSDGRLSGNVYRFISWVGDPYCTAAVNCTGTTNYKRVTVEVTLNGTGGPTLPILLSSIATDPSR
jgi:type II secretory pathway pseudopilin PulG